MNENEIIFVEYNGAGRPFQVYTNKLEGYDFFMKNKEICCEWSSGNIRPFLNKLTDKWKGKIKIWFNEDFRPSTNNFENNYILSNDEIVKLGYVIIDKPKYLTEIIEAIDNY